MPTGTGKTIVFALLVQRRRGRSLILAHRDELIQQAADKLRLVDPTLPLGVVQATRDEHTAPTVVASVQTLSRRSRLTRLVPNFQTIVIDEAHHAPAPTYRRILEYCRAWHPDGPLVVGVTATPERGDHHSLRQVFDGIVYQKTLLEMMQAGYLVDLRAFQVLLQADFNALRTQQGDFVEAELEHLLLTANAPAQVLAAFGRRRDPHDQWPVGMPGLAIVEDPLVGWRGGVVRFVNDNGLEIRYKAGEPGAAAQRLHTGHHRGGSMLVVRRLHDAQGERRIDQAQFVHGLLDELIAVGQDEGPALPPLDQEGQHNGFAGPRR